MLDFSQLYELADGYPNLLMGDLNAYHYKLGDNASGRSNNNGKKLVSFMENNQDVLNILNGPEPAHLQGNKLDYICLINDPAMSHHCEVVDTLTSDHFGVYGEILLPDTLRRHSMSRKRLCVPKKHEQRIREQMNNWYKHYTASSTEEFNTDIIHQLESKINMTVKHGKRNTMSEMKRWYNSDEAVQRIDRQYKKIKHQWQNNPTHNNLTILKRMGHQVQDVKKKAREKYWTSFLQSMDHRTPLAEVSRKIKIVQGKKAPSPLHPDPTKKSNELMQEWADASSYDCLPLQVRSALATNARNRIEKIEAALLDPNVSDNMPITEEELVRSLERQALVHPAWMVSPTMVFASLRRLMAILFCDSTT
ncbi:hypothetical protein GWK47_045294 [Chionoecetes opilio]|uniref:Endonuclease/exonuclease/phosphatase domain-containing protein n=1 Tax=Chionoecetes opilio TaxID=41210 RepID=A0A8J5CV94_CHIOP|nr:hypothetical protein GWK47_045294 [Chionoecetes opilio]